MSAIINFFARILPGWMGIRHTRIQQIDYFRQRHDFWAYNSIYLDNIINKIATDVATLKFKHVKIVRHADATDEMIWYEMSELAQCLTISPNDYETPVVFWADIMRKMLNDQIAIVIPTYSNGILQSLQLVDGVVDYDDHKLIVQIKDLTFEIDINSAWIFENPKQNISAQLGQITRLIDDNLRALSYKLSEGNSRLQGFLKVATKAEDGELKKRAEMRVANIMDAAKSSGVGYLQQGEEFQELNKEYGTASENELEFLKMQLYQAFGINEKLFTCDYTEEQYRAYYQSVLKVYQRVISDEINRKFFSKTARTQGHRLLVYFDLIDIVSLKDLNELAFKSKYAGIMNANEIREMYFGLPAYNGGDTYETNKNAVQIGTNNEVVL
jgi:hypothetical protein